jgi:succinylglutamate desuccinylase
MIMNIQKNLEDGILLSGNDPTGHTSVIIAGIHGNETCGVEAIEAILASLTIEKGIVHVIFGNPRALEQSTRFIDTNLNRLFRSDNLLSESQRSSYEYGRSRHIMKLVSEAGASLDIHSTLNESRPFIVCEKNASEIVQMFPADFLRTVRGFGSIEPGATDDYMNAQGKIGITIECGSHNDPRAKEIATMAILEFLRTRGHISGSLPELQGSREIVQMDSLYYSTSDSFKLSRKFYDFETISAGTLIGLDATKSIFAAEDYMIVFAHDCHKIGEEAFLLGHRVL